MNNDFKKKLTQGCLHDLLMYRGGVGMDGGGGRRRRAGVVATVRTTGYAIVGLLNRSCRATLRPKTPLPQLPFRARSVLIFNETSPKKEEVYL
jgi:hypothetical protein